MLAAEEIELALCEATEAIDSTLPVEVPYTLELAATETEDNETEASESAELYCEEAESRILCAGDLLVLPTAELADPRIA